MSGKIRVTVQVEQARVYEIDVDQFVADDYFEDVDMSSVEAIVDRLDEWLAHEPDDWKAPWARELSGLSYADRDVYEVDLNPPVAKHAGGGEAR